MAAVLREEGHTVAIYDAEHTADTETMSWLQAAEKYEEYPKALTNGAHLLWTEVKEVLHHFAPDLVGISVLSVKIPSALKIAELCKEWNRDVPVVVGGDHPTVFPEKALEDPNVDVVVRREGEATMAELASCLENGNRLESILGISYRKGEVVRHNPDRELIPDLDALPLPAIDALIGRDAYRPVEFGAIMASRGCPYACSFCGVANLWTRKTRFRSPSSVLEEMKSLHQRYATDYFSFRDASFTLDRNRVMALCEGILAHGMDIQWECLTRADLLDDQLLSVMKRSGCITVRLGVESGSQEMLRYLEKDIDLESARRAAGLLHNHRFYWSAYVLFGTPRETKDTIRKTMDFIRELSPPFITLGRFAPIPGTPLFDELVQAGRVFPDMDWSMESNQRFRSNYVLSMSEEEFEDEMRDAAAFVDNHNRAMSEMWQRQDQRLKL